MQSDQLQALLRRTIDSSTEVSGVQLASMSACTRTRTCSAPHAFHVMQIVGESAGAACAAHAARKAASTSSSIASDAAKATASTSADSAIAQENLQSQHGQQGSATATVRRRFQRGSIDEVAFPGPNLGPLAAIMVGPQAGNWEVEEVRSSFLWLPNAVLCSARRASLGHNSQQWLRCARHQKRLRDGMQVPQQA